MSNYSRLWVLALALFCVVVSTGPLQAQQGRIEGVVMAGTSRVDDADVVIPALGRRVAVDSTGTFVFERIPPGSYVIEAQSVRFGRGLATVQVASTSTAGVTIMMEPVFHLDELIVSAVGGAARSSEAYQPASVITSRDLVARGEASLGETLSRLPGVSSTYFGPGASRPVIRGIGGDRIRILEGGIGVGDASSTSPDHAVGLEARTADRIEVVRGPATLLYGSSAVGGVVNVLDSRIAREPPTQAVSGYVEGVGGSVADERTGSAGLTASSGAIVATGSMLWRNSSDYAIPGFAEIDAHPDEERGSLENSAVENRRGSLGLTVVGERGYLGVSGTVQRSDYGVPGGHGEEDEGSDATEEEGPITIDLDQKRADVEGMLRFYGGPFRNVKARLGVADYQHVELEGEEVGTSFFNEYVEARLDSEHSFSERMQGSLGAQLSTRDFEAIGDEAFVPPSQTRVFALFGYENLRATEGIKLQGGLRYEHQRAEAPTVDRTNEAVSASLGVNIQASDVISVSLSGSRSVKLPNAEELFSNGPHAATRTFEIGDPDLTNETALGIDFTTHFHAERFRGSASVFTNGFSDYIHERATGQTVDGLDEFLYVQDDARFTGFEVEGEVDVAEGDPGAGSPHVSLEFMADYVRARLTGTGEGIPRIPAMTLGTGANYRQGPLVMRVSARRTMEQADTA
ncbi:MAG: TonB-dependent receptor, partial [Verrucomicrobia bacterium]|nr:TonB-dependent receptor [Verrucomicrobiota bacterium]